MKIFQANSQNNRSKVALDGPISTRSLHMNVSGMWKKTREKPHKQKIKPGVEPRTVLRRGRVLVSDRAETEIRETPQSFHWSLCE